MNQIIQIEQKVHKDQLRAIIEKCGFKTTPDTFRNLDNPQNGHYRNLILTINDGKALRVGIILEAVRQRPDSQLDEEMTLATTSFLPGKKPEKMLFSPYGDSGRVIDILTSQGFAHQDGDRLDMTGFYDSYMQQHQQMMIDSPVSHVRYHEAPDKSLSEGSISCRIGGIEQSYEWVGTTGKRIQDVVDVCPDTRFQFYELVKDTHAKHIALYHEAQKRVTDFKAYTHLGDYHIRCKIDGVQQFSKTVGRLDICDYKRDHNIAALCAKYYENELDAGQKLNCNRSR